MQIKSPIESIKGMKVCVTMEEIVQEMAPGAAFADYLTSDISFLQGNPLVEALPAAYSSDEEIREQIAFMPDFDESQTELPDQTRLMLVQSIADLFVPFERNVNLARQLDTVIRFGYRHRELPSMKLQNAKPSSSSRRRNREKFSSIASQKPMSMTLIAGSGSGKSTAVTNSLSGMPQVIFHPQHNLYQITYLIVEIPSTAKSDIPFLKAVIAEIDRLLPGFGYKDTYLPSSKASSMRGVDWFSVVCDLLRTHQVGILVIEEAQKLAKYTVGTEETLNSLLTIINSVKVPVLTVGTPAAMELLDSRLQDARRACGLLNPVWQNLAFTQVSDNDEDQTEFETLIHLLASFNWTKTEIQITPELLHEIFFYSQGIVAVITLLFIFAQTRAIIDGSENVTSETFRTVYENDLVFLHPMLKAHRDKDFAALSEFEDMKLSLSDIAKELGVELSKDGVTDSTTHVRRILCNKLIQTGLNAVSSDRVSKNALLTDNLIE